MRPRSVAVAFVAGVLAGCMASSPPTPAQSPTSEPHSPAGSPFSDARMGANGLGVPLIIDRNDVSIGTTVQFSRFPTASEVNDATQLPGFARLVLSLPYWPEDLEPMRALDNLPAEVQVIVVVPGYPPNRAAAEAWNRVNARLRIVIVVPGPPASRAVLDDLNLMRGLERVIAQMDDPSRFGFELLQRPLSFRKVID
jgi:hypothetical protein